MDKLEVVLIVRDCLAAAELYKDTFHAEILEQSNFDLGLNESTVLVGGVRLHLLDENASYGLIASKEPMLNLEVENLDEAFIHAIEKGFSVISPITEKKGYGIRHALVCDQFSIVWMLTHVFEVVSFEDRCKLFEAEINMPK